MVLQTKLSTYKKSNNVLVPSLLIFPLLAQMSLSSTHAGSSSQLRPSPPADGPRTSSSDGFEDQTEPLAAAVWKRRYLALKDTVNDQTLSKRKSR
jgi:hypothetical protein